MEVVVEEEKKINNFYELTSNITSFSHAYLFAVDSLEKTFPLVIEFAKKIICPHKYAASCDNEECNICHLIDNNSFDDLYIVNPETITIKKEEIDNLMNYFQTKSIRENGHRVYIIYGFERLREDVSNKILKFLEEPEDNIHAILMTENPGKILSTIISRCQVINIKSEDTKIEDEIYLNMIGFLEKIIKIKEETIAYVNQYFGVYILDREKIEECFSALEKIILNEINYRNNIQYDENIMIKNLSLYDMKKIVNFLEITSRKKSLIKRNINLPLLLDSYIIEVSKE